MLGLLFLAVPAAAQVRDFSCVGAERLEDDTAVVPFPARRDRVDPAALASLEPLVAKAREAGARNLCVLGFAAPQEGGAETASRLAARRARAVSLELAKLGVERDRIRAEARTRGFLTGAARGRAGGVEHSAGVRVVLLPAQ
jgi:outer membrane protein OmpA-like peptidoglycan-associated protein